MKLNVLVLFILLLCFSCKNTSEKEEEVIEDKGAVTYETIKNSKWLLGNWNRVLTENETHENWRSLNDSTLVLHGFTLVKNDTVFYEKVLLQQTSEGSFFRVQNMLDVEEPEVVFTLISKAKDSLVFENSTHDFPQRILYWKPKADTLKARIEGQVEGELQAINFYFTR